MQITVNGNTEIIQPCRLGDLVQSKGLNAETLVVEYNQRIIKRAHWNEIELQENDTLELLNFVGGG